MSALWPLLVLVFHASREPAPPPPRGPAIGIRDDLAPPRMARGQRVARIAIGPWAPDPR